MSFQSNHNPQNWRDVVFLQILRSKLQWASIPGADVSVTVVCAEDLSRVSSSFNTAVLCSTSSSGTTRIRAEGAWRRGHGDRVAVTFVGQPFRTPWYFGLLRMVPSDLQDFFLARYRARSLAKEVWSLRGEVEGVDKISAFIDPFTFRVAAYGERSAET